MFRYSIGRERQLFVDDLLVAETDNLEKVLHQPVKCDGNPVIAGDHPLENDWICLHGSVLFDEREGLFKAWYLVKPSSIGYAVSEDGISWRKPELDVFSDGGKKTHVVYKGIHPDRPGADSWKIDGCSVMIDPDEEDQSRRYKMFSFQCPMSEAVRKADPYAYAYFVATSADGICWTTRTDPVISKRQDPNLSDAFSCMYDPLKHRFIAFTKRHQFCPNGIGDQDTAVRVRGISFSSDFQHWTRPVTCLCPDDCDPRDVNFYRMGGWTYEGMYLGVVEIYYSDHRRADKPLMRDIQLISSRDGELWWRAGGRNVFIPCGPEGAWDSKMLDVNSNGPILVGDELWIYYGGRSCPHERHPEFFPGEWRSSSGIGLAKLRRDGFVSYDATDQAGTLLTKPIQFQEARGLHLNVDASHGTARVEILSIFDRAGVPDRNPAWKFGYGEPVEGFRLEDAVPVRGDCLDAAVCWKKGDDLSRFAGEWIALRISLEHARLYSFWFE